MEGQETTQGNDDKDENKRVEELEMEVERLKRKCDGYERMILDLKSRSDTHKNALEMIRQQIIHLHDSQGTPNTTYGSNNYDIMP